jgi:hypothetical protein
VTRLTREDVHFGIVCIALAVACLAVAYGMGG